jgi:hypothetical protein
VALVDASDAAAAAADVVQHGFVHFKPRANPLQAGGDVRRKSCMDHATIARPHIDHSEPLNARLPKVDSALEACLREQPAVCMRRSIASSVDIQLFLSDFDFSTFSFHVPISGLLCADATCGNDAIPNPSISISMVRRFMMLLL